MPSDLLKAYSKETGIPVSKMEKYWDKAKDIAKSTRFKDVKNPEEKDGFWKYVQGIVQNMMGDKYTKESIEDFINEAKKSIDKWSSKVDTKWAPPEGFFNQSSKSIANGLKSSSDDLETAMGRLNFYINRAGKNLSKLDKGRLEKVKTILHDLYKQNEEIEEDISSMHSRNRNVYNASREYTLSSGKLKTPEEKQELKQKIAKKWNVSPSSF